LYLQVVDSILRAIDQGRIQPGMVLPSIRDLAERLGVTVNTILAALRELQAQGWLTSQQRSGFFVSESLPSASKASVGAPVSLKNPGFDLPEHLRPITSQANVVMDLTDGLADARLAPAQALGRAYQRGLRLRGAELLAMRDAMGLRRLREGLGMYLGLHRGVIANPDQILVLRSSSMALTLAAQALIGSAGGIVALENPGNPEVWETLRLACPAELQGLPVDAEGLLVEPLERLLESAPNSVRLLVLTPQCHFPTGVRLADSRRARILELSRKHRFPILEMDPEFDYLGSPGTATLASLDAGQVMYVGSLSRIMAPGLRAAYLVAPVPMAELLARARQRIDWQGDPVQEWALAELLLDGEIKRQILRVRKAAQERREALTDALRHTLGEMISFDPERGSGRLESPAAFTTWIKGCQAWGLKLRPGRYYDLHNVDTAATRLGFTAYTPEELQKAVALMV
jgi:GntR family transcriptional regulator/MocR family aminotransferase